MAKKATAKAPASFPALQSKKRAVRFRFDSAVTNTDNTRHWANADGLSADAAASASVRTILRNRARYEVANNGYAAGMVATLANDTIGTGPRLQMLTDDDKINSLIEEEFDLWASEVNLADVLQTMRTARTQDGESFTMLVSNPMREHIVKLDLRQIEADLVTSPFSQIVDEEEADGIRFDKYGNPVAYIVLKHHPGGNYFQTGTEYRSIHANHMIHLFRQQRAGQHRGVPEITPALPLYAQLRRYTLAVIAAAETAADYAAVIYTDAPADGELVEGEAFGIVELEARMATTLPAGYKLGQIKAEQPTTTYAEFKKEILNEIARCLNMPFNVAAGNSAGYNYASGRLDHQVYYKTIKNDQAFIARRALDRILKSWLWEFAAATAGDVGTSLRKIIYKRGLPSHNWFWDGVEHVDPAKEANAQKTRLENKTTTLATEYARQGKDWETELHQLAREKKLLKSLGLTEDEAAPKGQTDEKQ